MDTVKIKAISRDSGYTKMISEEGTIYRVIDVSGQTSFYIGDGVRKISELSPVMFEESNILYYEDHVSILCGTKYIDIKKDEFEKNFIKKDDVIKLYKDNECIGYYLANKIPIM